MILATARPGRFRLQIQVPAMSWKALAIRHAREHAWAAAGLAVAATVSLWLLLHSLVNLVDAGGSAGLSMALWGGAAGFAATAIGALPALVMRGLPQAAEDSLLGFAAGMMLAAAAFSLLLPSLESASALLGEGPLAGLVVVAGIALGAMLMLGLDAFTPHEHDKTGPCGPGHAYCGRIWLFVFAIALHNLPEGMAIGVAFSQGDLAVGLPVATAISLQDIPEGLAVALALRTAGYPAGRSVAVAVASGLMEPMGALLGVGLSSGFALAYPIGLALAAGAMVFVVSHEVIPETHRNGHQTPATLGLVAGFALMMFLDTSLG